MYVCFLNMVHLYYDPGTVGINKKLHLIFLKRSFDGTDISNPFQLQYCENKKNETERKPNPNESLKTRH